jgi:secreted trypsin-like serine protease
MTDAATPDRARELADELAREFAAGDEAAHAHAMQRLMAAGDQLAAVPETERLTLARTLVGAAPRGRIYDDPVFQQNLPLVTGDRRRIVGGRPTRQFPDCVAVGSARGWCCTGTLVAANLVVTAAHCPVDDDCAHRVMFGFDTSPSGGGRVMQVAAVHVHPDYIDEGPNDLAALVLERDARTAPPRRLATNEQLAQARTVRLVGFGFTDTMGTHGYGIKREVDVPVASDDPAFGADPAVEFVAGKPALERDSCNGDSGGPAYVEHDGAWLLAGATSRAILNAIRPCGDGGIYARMPAYDAWLRCIPGAHFRD